MCHQPAELFVYFFHSFEAGIANAISSFKWRKLLLFMKNIDISNIEKIFNNICKLIELVTHFNP